MIEQWGVSSSNYRTVTFNVSFTNTNYIGIVTTKQNADSSPDEGTVKFYPINNNSAKVTSGNTAVPYWHAIGY